MADGDGGSRTEPASWEWEPSRRYGPFVFGTPLQAVPYLGPETDREGVGSDDVSTSHDSSIEGYSLAFWNGVLNGVECYRTFVYGGVEVVGATFEEIRGLFGIEPVVRNYDPILMVVYDELDLVLFTDMDWRVTSVYVSIDPERLPA